jgi:hypothetical protein
MKISTMLVRTLHRCQGSLVYSLFDGHSKVLVPTSWAELVVPILRLLQQCRDLRRVSLTMLHGIAHTGILHPGFESEPDVGIGR